ncbi:MAG TPA: T9SS type A sorting domain-containing protein, partial [bacterium]
KSNIPTDYTLYQNHPNPFNSLTTIRYAIPTTSYTTLKIYNLLGKERATLVNEKQSAGEYEVQWDSVDLPSGVYVYRLEAGDFIATRKLILMK